MQKVTAILRIRLLVYSPADDNIFRVIFLEHKGVANEGGYIVFNFRCGVVENNVDKSTYFTLVMWLHVKYERTDTQRL